MAARYRLDLRERARELDAHTGRVRRVRDGAELSVTITDQSPTGLAFLTDEPLEVGETLEMLSEGEASGGSVTVLRQTRSLQRDGAYETACSVRS